MSEQQASSESPEPEWPTCNADRCIGIPLDGEDNCLSHAGTEARSGYLAGLQPGKSVDLRGTSLSSPLLDAILDFTKSPDGLPVLGEAKFQQARFLGDARFDGTQFSGDASFGGARFLGLAWFARTSFSGAARFEGAQFSKGASFVLGQFLGSAGFRGVQFSRSVGFFKAHFLKNAWFDGAEFSGQPGFEDAQFFADADFRGTQFFQAQEFGPVLVASRLMLDYAHFAETIVIDVAAASLSCVATTFQQTATFRVRYAEIVLDRALFAKPATLAYAEAGFGRSIGLHMPTFDESILRDIGRRPQPRLLSVRQVDVSNLVLASIDLTACLLWGAHHLDQLRIEGPNPFPFTPRGWHLGRVWGQGLPIWRWTRRQTVAEEHIWQAQRRLPSSLAGRPHPKFMGWNPPPARLLRMVEHSTGQAVRRLEPDRLALLYRRLRKGREDSKNEPGAADFYYGEMEMRRRAIETPWVERVILSVYWLVSGYGLRGLRALLTLLVVVAGVAVLFQHIGLYQPVRPHSYLAAVLYAAESMLSLASGGVQLGVSVRTVRSRRNRGRGRHSHLRLRQGSGR